MCTFARLETMTLKNGLRSVGVIKITGWYRWTITSKLPDNVVTLKWKSKNNVTHGIDVIVD